jgi:hypothetical protein
MGAVTELVLPGSGIHVQWNEEVGGWRFLTRQDADNHRMGTVVTPVTWRYWTGDSASIIKRSVTWKNENLRRHWWAIAGELPTPDSSVAVVADQGTPSPVSIFIDGRLWACECEWFTRPTAATVTISDKAAVTLGFGRKVARRQHYGQPAEPQADQPKEDGYRRGGGWYGKPPTGDTRPPGLS